MIKLIFIIVVQFASSEPLQIASHKQQIIYAHELCKNKPDIRYQIEDGLICLPIDEIFKDGFESNKTKVIKDD